MLCTNGKWRFSQSMAWLLNGMHDLARWSSLSSRFLIELSVCSVLFSSLSDNLQIFFICFTTKGSVMIINYCFLSFRDEAFSGNDSLKILISSGIVDCHFHIMLKMCHCQFTQAVHSKKFCVLLIQPLQTTHSDFGSLSL